LSKLFWIRRSKKRHNLEFELGVKPTKQGIVESKLFWIDKNV
jgi:hypothetical protein